MFRFYENKSIAEKYIKYRPDYPTQLATQALGDLKEKKFNFLLDVGCGGGQSVNIFAPYFYKVLAIDPSEYQLTEARSKNQFAHVTFKQGVAEELPCDDVSVDVITCGICIHWFDRPKFYEEVNRVLKPGGRLVVFSYWDPKIVSLTGNGDVTELSKTGTQLLADALSVGASENPFLQKIQSLSRNRYNQIFSEMMLPKKRRYDVSKEFTWSLIDAKGFIQSIDAYESYMKSKELEMKGLSEEKRNARLFELDYSENFVRSLKERWHCTEMENADVKMKAIFTFFVIVAEKPNQ